MMWLGVAWDVLKAYFTDALLYWRRRRKLPSTPLSDWVRDENREWPPTSCRECGRRGTDAHCCNPDCGGPGRYVSPHRSDR